MDDKPHENPDPLVVLEHMAAMPVAYWGGSDNHFHSFAAYCLGSKHPVPEIIPDDFDQFVTEHFGFHFPDQSRGWRSFVEERTSSDTEALQLVLELRRLYEAKKQNAEQDLAQNPSIDALE